MNNKPNDINPIVSKAESDLFFTDPNYELSGPFTGKTVAGQRTLRKKPWFSQKMNIRGRIFQALIVSLIATIGFGVGLKFLKIPPTAQAIKLLFKHGYRGPYEGLQVIDMDLRPAHNPETHVVSARITLFNFTSDFVTGGPIHINLKQSTQPKISQHQVQCCNSPIAPSSEYTMTTIIRDVAPNVQYIEAKTL